MTPFAPPVPACIRWLSEPPPLRSATRVAGSLS